MTMQTLEALMDQRDECRNAALAMAESDNFDPTDETFTDLQSRAEQYDGRVAALNKLIDQQHSADQLDSKLARHHQRQEQRQQEPVQSRQSWGEVLTRSSEFTDYRYKGSSGIVTIDDDLQSRALPMSIEQLVTAGLSGAKTVVDTTAPLAPTPLLDSISQVQVSGNAVEFLQWKKTAGGAATVAEGQPKPSVEFSPVVTPDVLENIAAWVSLTRQMLEDFTAVRSMVDTELRREIAREEEEHAVAALGAATLPTATGDSLIEAVRVGIGTVQAAGYSPDAVMLNPADYAALDIAVMGATLLGPTVRQNFWGLTPIPASSQAEGTAIVGSFQTAVTRFYRSQISLWTSDSAQAGDFIKNIFTILAERRSKTVVVRPQALVEVSGA